MEKLLPGYPYLSVNTFADEMSNLLGAVYLKKKYGVINSESYVLYVKMLQTLNYLKKLGYVRKTNKKRCIDDILSFRDTKGSCGVRISIVGSELEEPRRWHNPPPSEADAHNDRIIKSAYSKLRFPRIALGKFDSRYRQIGGHLPDDQWKEWNAAKTSPDYKSTLFNKDLFERPLEPHVLHEMMKKGTRSTRRGCQRSATAPAADRPAAAAAGTTARTTAAAGTRAAA